MSSSDAAPAIAITVAVFPLSKRFSRSRCRPEDTAVNAEEQGSAPTHTLTDFFGPTATIPGFTLVPYLGPEARPILDSSGHVAAVFGGMPDEPDFMANVHDPAVEAMEDARTRASISEERQSHRRGVFTQLTAGVSFGGGQVQPGALVNGAINAASLASLLSSDPFIRLAGFATTGDSLPIGPQTSLFYRRYTRLKRPFVNGIFFACTFNLGPHTCALGHRDFANFALGWCPITAFGRFDYRKGGHLILWDCRLVLEFPPGCTIIIPSAAIFHSNIPSLLMSATTLSLNTPPAASFVGREEKELGLRSMFSTLDELKAM
ncbi:hypothetical protein C8R47DRAFT_1317631 [Mycena vitilis]|nr:hypothetical protein C8R47DRAFT_1317631 [Mycena vitilis]